jgi:CDP-diacylglycerol--glycerol-3-phosphate 3-phosphatidyltransferase
MTPSTDEQPGSRVFNVPNQITGVRFLLAIVNFVLMPLGQYLPALILFVVAASTDWIDGYWARRYGQVTKLGRVFDPFVDKFIICGMFIFLAAERGSGVAPWMAVVVVARELLVTTLRTFIEQSGGDFSARMSGKLKMVFQCLAVCVSLVALMMGGESAADWLRWTLLASVWLAVLSTIQSGLGYVMAAAKFFRE